MDVLYFLVYIFIGFLAYYRYKNHQRYEYAKKFPGPPTLPILGNLHMLYSKTPQAMMKFIADTKDLYGSIYRVWVGSKLSFVITDPKVSEIILGNATTNLTKNTIYDFLYPWLGEGLLLSTGSKWHSRRKIITPAFHFRILEQFIEIFDKQSKIFVEKLRAYEKHESFNVMPVVTLMALDIVSETSMGIQLHAQTDAQSPYSKAVHEISRIITQRFTRVWQRNDFLFKTFAPSDNNELQENLHILHSFTDDIIRRRRNNLMAEVNHSSTNKNTNNNDDDDDGEFEFSKKQAFLDILLKATVDGVPLTDRDIREEVDTFMFEGHDTVTSGISFALYLLSRNKHVQDKLFDEIQEIFGDDKNRPVTYRDLSNLKYLELVIKETLRLYPSVPFIGRTIEEDTIIGKDRVLPKNSGILINFYLMFRDPKLFNKPNDFIPERFENANEQSFHTYAYTPFSAGSRNCIGQKFAILEMKSSISKVIRNYELLPVGPEPDVIMELILRSANGVHIGLRPRKY